MTLHSNELIDSTDILKNKHGLDLNGALFLASVYANTINSNNSEIEKLKNELQIEKDRANTLELATSKPCKDCKFNNCITTKEKAGNEREQK